MKIKFLNIKIILEGPEDKLQLTKNTQPAILIRLFNIKIIKEEYNFNLNIF